MSKFDNYFLMKTEDVIDYVKEKLNIFDDNADLEAKEIGDGNLNYVFRVWDKNSDKSVIVKQAGDTARISEDIKLSTDRNRIEAEILELEGKLAPGLVPVVYKYDDIMSCCSMEDLSDHAIMRKALLEHKKFPQFAEDITTFMVNTLLLTSDVVMEHKEKKEAVKNYINPELCEITEDLVYTEPYLNDKDRNSIFEPNKEWMEQEYYNDKELHLEVAKLKFEFMNNAQSLLHGDLHTGSIFIKEDSTYVIDPEFAFYGPAGYDVGNVIANLIFAWANADATIEDAAKREDYTKWVEDTIEQIIDLFNVKFLASFKENATDLMAKVEGFDRWYLDTVIRDTAAVAGLELARRTIGLAKVKDITSIEEPNARVRAERICVTIAKNFMKNRNSFKAGRDFVANMKNAQNQFAR